MKIYAKTCDPQCFDYRVYDIQEDEGNEVFIDGGREFCNIDNKGYLTKIKKLLNEYNDYELQVYHGNSIMDFLNYYMPKKENGKRLSPREAAWLKKVLDCERDDREAICQFLSTITGQLYKHKGLRGCCQGDYVDAYYPVQDGITQYLDYVEAWYFGTGTEVMVHDGDEEITDPNDISGCTFYTEKYRIEDIKQMIADEYGCDSQDVVLYVFDGYRHTPKYQIQ